MKRILLLLVLTCSIVAEVNAQKTPYPVRPKINIGAEFGIPRRSGFGEYFNFGFGGSGKLEVPFTAALYGTASAGFISYYSKRTLIGSNEKLNNKSYIPLKLGVRYYLSKAFYGAGELGASVGVQRNSGSSMIWAPGVGFLFPLSERGALDAGVRYERWVRDGGNIDQVGIRVAYQF
ncbi:hypothetical protein [Rubrolithibacter danxiaensis]|uniref:hypothetical protein n=1 Tax=Rubrolithibacter danxiaensis TaxID=3390805 RepID=UPI003BF793AC